MTVKRTFTCIGGEEKPNKADRVGVEIEDPDMGNQLCELFTRILTAPCDDREKDEKEGDDDEMPRSPKAPATTDNIGDTQYAWQNVLPIRESPYWVGRYVEITCPIQYEHPTTGVVAPGTLAKIQNPPDVEGEMEVVLSDGREIDVFKEEVLLLDLQESMVIAALVILRTEAVLASYQATIRRRLERVRQQVVADFEAALVLRPPGLELLPQKGREEAFRLHVDNTYTSNMKAVLHDRYKKMYGKAYIEIVGPSDPTPSQKKGRKVGAALVAAATIVAISGICQTDVVPLHFDYSKTFSPRGSRRKRTSRHRRPILAVVPQA